MLVMGLIGEEFFVVILLKGLQLIQIKAYLAWVVGLGVIRGS
jgi:hypothetical protein